MNFHFVAVPRPDEVEFNNATAGQETRDFIEGEDEQASKTYIKALPTILELTRQFKVTGTRYFFFTLPQKTRLKRLSVSVSAPKNLELKSRSDEAFLYRMK